MTQKTDPNTEPVRLLFEMTREDNPRLYDDLIRFNKGTKRVNRLRFLAHEGLLAQNWLLMSVADGLSRPPRAVLPASMSVNPVAAGHVVQAFDAPAIDGED
ncbi:hypothetical protein [Rhodoferax sp.]|jgi:hypothetical protein|uniref:hypothetical protein n=1 Tax=Rhodoferax sp. TaxID=50421 RepID=UPI002719ED34|nr:hypothetical protein [Rhodoferax sp.]MDO9199100.1 hypothetical protein [Rhodoferax sp.]MDR3367697.1 hypothetical protein [Rhodoferax sp.]